MKNLMDYAASPTNPPKGYGLEGGIAIARYRNERLNDMDWPRSISYEDAVKIIEKEILEKFGAPK